MSVRVVSCLVGAKENGEGSAVGNENDGKFECLCVLGFLVWW